MENKMSRPKFLILITVFYLILYIVLKIFIVYAQDLYMKNEVYETTYNIGKVLKINSYTEEEKSSTDYFSSNSDVYKMKVKNYFTNFESGDSDTNYEYYLLYDENNNIVAAFMLGQFDTQMHNIHSLDEASYFSEFNHFPLYISSILRNYFLDKNNIHNDIDLIKFIRQRKRLDCRFTTPIVKIKENYFFNFVETMFPELKNITYIEGDLEGYIIEREEFKQVCIIKNNRLYCITFFKLDYFTDDVINDILRSLVIEK